MSEEDINRFTEDDIAVSYTHLDVYKRQELVHGLRVVRNHNWYCLIPVSYTHLKGGGMKVLLRYFLTEKVTKRSCPLAGAMVRWDW